VLIIRTYANYEHHFTRLGRRALSSRHRVACLRTGSLSLQCLEVIDDFIHLLRFELELRHLGVTSSNPFPERLLKVFDRVALVEIAERRCFRHWAVPLSPNRVTGRAIHLNDGAPFSLVHRLV
jgi:hypothetical protein